MAFKRYEGFVMHVPQEMIDNGLPVCPFCHSNQPHWLLDSKMHFTETRTYYRCERCEATMSSNSMDAAASKGKQFALNPLAAGINAAKKGSKGQEVGVTYFKIESLGRVCQNSPLLGQELSLTQLQAMAGTAAPRPIAPPAAHLSAAPTATVPPVVTPQPTAPVPPVAAPQPAAPVPPVAAPQPAAPVPPVAAPQPAAPVPPVAAPQPAAPVAPQPVQQPVQYQQPVYQQPIPQYQPPQPPVYHQPQAPVYPQAPLYPQAPAQPLPAPVKREKGPSLVLPILAVVFGLLAVLSGMMPGMMLRTLAENGVPFAVATLVFSIIRFIFCIPALIFGIIGLIKSLKGKKIVGAAVAAAGLLMALYALIMVIILICNIVKYTL